MLRVPRLSRKMQRCQSDPLRRQASADIYAGAESATPATQIQPEMLKSATSFAQNAAASIRPLRRQGSADIYTESGTCHANRACGAASATAVRQNASASIRPTSSPSFRGHLRRCGGTESVTPATQI